MPVLTHDENKYQTNSAVFPAKIITTEREAIEAAKQVAKFAAEEAQHRDQQRVLPHAALDLFTHSGLGSITIPKEFGGPQLSFSTVAEVFRIISAVDPALGQIPQNHFGILQLLSITASEEQLKRLYGSVLAGWRIGNGGPERGTKDTLDMRTCLTKTAAGLVLNGEKFYSTGALFAHWVAIKAIDDNQQPVITFIPKHTEGLHIVDDWSGMGQRTTASGTIKLHNALVAPENVIALAPISQQPNIQGAVSQLIQAAIDAGIAHGALEEAKSFIRERSRPWIDANVERNSDDLYIIADVGRLTIELNAANALLKRAASILDQTQSAPITSESAAYASIAVAEAKVLTTDIALAASEKLFEWAGSRSTLAEFGLDRHWRNARTHTLHDPVRWKFHAIGQYRLNGIFPARHSWI